MSGNGRRRANGLLALELAAGKSVKDAAAAVGLSERTVRRRLKLPRFVARVNRLRAGMISEAAGRLADGMAEAADKLRLLMNSDDEAVALRAAVRVVQLGTKAAELCDLQARVEALEQKQREPGT